MVSMTSAPCCQVTRLNTWHIKEDENEKHMPPVISPSPIPATQVKSITTFISFYHSPRCTVQYC